MLLLFASITSISSAQISVGLKGGYTMAWEFYNLELPEDAEITVNGINISGMVYKGFGKHWQVGFEPGFVKRGAACIPGWQPIFEGDTKFILNYVELPMMAAFNLPVMKGKMEVFGKAGYGISRLVTAFSQTILVTNEDPEPREPLPIGPRSIINPWDHGAYTGAGVRMQLGPGKLQLASDFYLGMRDAERWNTSKNRSVNVNLGYLITL